MSLQDHEPDLPRIFSETGNCCRRQYTSLPILQKQQNLFSEECLLLSSPASFACVCVCIPLVLLATLNYCQMFLIFVSLVGKVVSLRGLSLHFSACH